ncbi:bacteriohemerythrin [Colwellia sp. KU-HH00111]|uniref:bacteriohemerythrin n=1 Tax=Colwellia sp. KU-HH00111 TaxID=3127652 RepID=UPI003103DD74
MHTYEWKKQYYIGLDLIDSEHSNLFACINKLVIAQHFEQSIILSLADEVISYAEFHFLSETNFMRILNYPKLKEHMAYHNELTQELWQRRDKLTESTSNLQKFIEFIVTWFVEHTQTIDREFAAYVNEIKPLPNSPKAKLKEIVLTHKI